MIFFCIIQNLKIFLFFYFSDSVPLCDPPSYIKTKKPFIRVVMEALNLLFSQCVSVSVNCKFFQKPISIQNHAIFSYIHTIFSLSSVKYCAGVHIASMGKSWLIGDGKGIKKHKVNLKAERCDREQVTLPSCLVTFKV